MCIFRPVKLHRKKVRGIHVDFSTSEIASKKVRGIHVDFSTIEITSKKHAEMTGKFVEIWSSMYQCNIHVESTWIRRGVPVGVMMVYIFVTFWSYSMSLSKVMTGDATLHFPT